MSLSEEKARELVLCVRRNDVDALFGDHASHGEPWLTLGNEETVDFWLSKATVAFLPRSIAEESPAWRHLCTYSVLRDGDRVFTYRRGVSGSESRLHGLRSLGVGGHVSIEDYEPRDGIDGRIAASAALREMLEEVDIPFGTWGKLRGLIADDSTPVNSVHLGIVYLAEIDSKCVHAYEDCLADPQWLTMDQLRDRRDEMEVWSRIVLDRLLLSDGGRS